MKNYIYQSLILVIINVLIIGKFSYKGYMIAYDLFIKGYNYIGTSIIVLLPPILYTMLVFIWGHIFARVNFKESLINNTILTLLCFIIFGFFYYCIYLYFSQIIQEYQFWLLCFAVPIMNLLINLLIKKYFMKGK